MFIEKLVNTDFEEFNNQETFSITNLENTSFATSGVTVLLLKSIKDGKMVRHYVTDFKWFDASDIRNIKDCSYLWQGYLLAKFKDSELYDLYLKELTKHYVKLNVKVRYRQQEVDFKKVEESISKVVEISNDYLNGEESEEV